MKQTILALALALAATGPQASEGDFTVHTVSAHVGVSDLNNINPGLGYDITDDLRVGAFYNSYELPSFYIAKLIHIPFMPRIRAGLGVISGYTWDWDQEDVIGETGGLLPLVAIEADITRNVSVLWFGNAVNLEIKL